VLTRAQVLLRVLLVGLVGAAGNSRSLSEVARNVRLGKQAQPVLKAARIARKVHLVSLMLSEQEFVILVFLVSFSQRIRQQRRAKVVRLDGIKRARENPRAKISVVSNPPIARTTSISTRPFVTASVVLSAPLVSVPLILHKSKQNLVGSSVPTILRNLRSVLFQVHALEDPTQHSPVNSLMPRKMILLGVPTARKDVTTSTDTPTAPDFADSARPTTAWMVSVESVKSVHL